MAITLLTGLPGNAKTLRAISFVKALSEKEGRPVFYSGIPELTLGWTEIDPLEWFKCPPKSIVVIDECQRVFRNRSLGSSPGKHVTELETHRHLGIDLVFITQHPSLVDPAIRKLTQCHMHMVRIWGMEASTIHQWDGVRDNCEKPIGREDSEKTKWVFDKSLYPLYKSSVEHTVKRSIPFRVKMLMVLPFIAVALFYYGYSILKGKKQIAANPVAMSSPGAVPGLSVVPGSSGVQSKSLPLVVTDPLADAKLFIAMQTPRVAGLPQTAPRYDDLTKPVRVPVPAMCIQRVSECRCYTQQGTPMDVSRSMCAGFARSGFFQDFNADGDAKESSLTAKSVKVMDGHDRVPLPRG